MFINVVLIKKNMYYVIVITNKRGNAAVFSRMLTFVSDPNPVPSHHIQSVYGTNTPMLSWNPNTGMVDYYLLTFTANSTGNSFSNTTTDEMFQANLEHGEKYEIEIIAVFRELNSSALYATTVIGKSSEIK